MASKFIWALAPPNKPSACPWSAPSSILCNNYYQCWPFYFYLYPLDFLLSVDNLTALSVKLTLWSVISLIFSHNCLLICLHPHHFWFFLTGLRKYGILSPRTWLISPWTQPPPELTTTYHHSLQLTPTLSLPQRPWKKHNAAPQPSNILKSA